MQRPQLVIREELGRYIIAVVYRERKFIGEFVSHALRTASTLHQYKVVNVCIYVTNGRRWSCRTRVAVSELKAEIERVHCTLFQSFG